MKAFTLALLTSAGAVIAQSSGRNDTAACAALAQSAPAALANLTVLISGFQASGLIINDTAQGGFNPAPAGPYSGKFVVAFEEKKADQALRLAMCRFRGGIKTSANTTVLFEVMMPPSNTWNGDFMHVGNGKCFFNMAESRTANGYSSGGDYGYINYQDMVVPLGKYGYSVASTDTGHQGSVVDGSPSH